MGLVLIVAISGHPLDVGAGGSAQAWVMSFMAVQEYNAQFSVGCHKLPLGLEALMAEDPDWREPDHCLNVPGRPNRDITRLDRLNSRPAALGLLAAKMITYHAVRDHDILSRSLLTTQNHLLSAMLRHERTPAVLFLSIPF